MPPEANPASDSSRIRGVDYVRLGALNLWIILEARAGWLPWWARLKVTEGRQDIPDNEDLVLITKD